VIGDASEVVGKLARTRLSAGTILREAVVEKPVVIRRNELVTVHCLSGSVALRVEARAMDEGREGDVIEFRVDRGSEPFTARVSGPGVAVATDEKGAE
jgi:flagella basal body P-ring formation protein FlgA